MIDAVTGQDLATQDVLDAAIAKAKSLGSVSPFKDEATLKQWVGRQVIGELRDKLPQRVWEARWISITGQSDTGINVELLSANIGKFRAFFGAMFGTTSAGLNISVPVYSNDRVLLAVGVGRAFDYSDFHRQSNVLIASARFTF